MIKQLNVCKYTTHTDFSFKLLCPCDLNSTLPPSLTSCILNVVDIFRDAVDVTSQIVRQRDSYIHFIYTDCIGKVEPATRKYFLRGNTSS